MSALSIALFSLGVAVVGAVTAIVSLAWQVATRARGTHNIAVETKFAWVVGDGFFDGATYVSIDVMNRGLSPVQVRAYAIEVPGNNTVIPTRSFLNAPELPYMLEAGTSVSFYMPAEAVVSQIGDVDRKLLRAVVRLGTGQTVRGKRGALSSIGST